MPPNNASGGIIAETNSVSSIILNRGAQMHIMVHIRELLKVIHRDTKERICRNNSRLINDFLFPNNKIVYGPCPSCGVNQRVYFGNILGVEGFDEVASAKCTNCKVQFQVQKNTMRASTVVPKN